MKNLCGFFLEFKMQKVEKMKAEMYIKSILHSNYSFTRKLLHFLLSKNDIIPPNTRQSVGYYHYDYEIQNCV